jgi:LysR family transcriptional regulator, cys regulon transcriptional activator
MTLTQLRYFAAIVDSNCNITLAAERVHATQPGLSKQLKQLEDHLGFMLFTRRGRALESLTADGESVLHFARKVLSESDNIRAYSANAKREQHGALLILTTPMQARYILPHPVSQLKARYPDVSVHIRSLAEQELLPQLRQRQADLAIISTASAVPEGGLALPLYSWRRLGVVPKAHPLAALRHVSLQALSTYPIISYENSDRADSSLRRAFEQRGLSPNIAITAAESDLIKDYVQSGLGIGIVSEVACYGEKREALHYFALPDEVPACICYAVLPRDRVLRTYVLDMLLDIAPQLERIAIQRAARGDADYAVHSVPTWLELSQPFAI